MDRSAILDELKSRIYDSYRLYHKMDKNTIVVQAQQNKIGSCGLVLKHVVIVESRLSRLQLWWAQSERKEKLFLSFQPKDGSR
eukprot:CAMPEP_0195314386 /NCGR_PEP_ID=MMETSP0708-20121125/2365_1 /TAXON_ID=33640 /ORGANISM="Asterionellopsis glacialis, Strain CCMP134" /LENGTH=82 /DNA_ID=CAMNT_0040379371 /DNA_START=105 /DNA_END=353 /DNA_ORIENTATION=-